MLIVFIESSALTFVPHANAITVAAILDTTRARWRLVSDMTAEWVEFLRSSNQNIARWGLSLVWY